MRMKCPICHGTGIQEETMKGYRRYKCWCCNGEKTIIDPHQPHTQKITMKKTNKYRTLRGFDQKSKAEKYLDKITHIGKDLLSIKERTFPSPAKTRFYVRELVRQGSK
tara:strand:+ start:1653 stop:1976 length:324 start_codon:yes stop_codon:yes gene_type:complete